MRRAFTLVDVLVSLMIMAILMALLLPTLNAVRETARQVVCRSNVRQVGLGIWQFAEHNSDRIPFSVNAGNERVGGRPWETTTLRMAPDDHLAPNAWDGLGWLYADDVLPTPAIFYCPSHRGPHHYRVYEPVWLQEHGLIMGNFQYRGRGPVGHRLSPAGPTHSTDRLSLIRPEAALVVDSLRSRIEFNHTDGANVLRAGGWVDWYPDREGTISALLPREGENPPPSVIMHLWRELDETP